MESVSLLQAGGYRICGAWQGKEVWNKPTLVTKINNNKMSQNTHREMTYCVRRYYFAIV